MMKPVSFIRISLIVLLALFASDISFSQKKAAKDFTLNFKDVEMTDFLNMMGQLTGKNIVYDEQVRGKLTISSTKKIPLSQAMDVMITVLSVKGYAIVESQNMLKVVPVKEAPKNDESIIVDGKPLKFGDDRPVVFIKPIENADMNEIVKTLNALKTSSMNIIVYAPLSSILFAGSATEVASLVKIAESLDQVANAKGKNSDDLRSYIHVVKLKNSKAEDLAAILSKVPTRNTINQMKGIATQPGSQAAAQNQPISIVASKDTNALIITCTPDEYSEIKKLIEDLDSVREQVLIEALIMEVNADNDWNFGIDWYTGASAGGGNILGNSVNGGTPTTSKVSLFGNKLSVFPNFAVGYMYKNSLALLRASATDSKVNILSTPQILTLDNQEAVIYAGEEIPILSKNSSTTGSTVSYNFEYKSVGLKLKVTPHITDSDKITLDLYQEANSILGQSETIGDTVIPPKLGKRDITTKVTVYNGKTIVVGGLMKDDKTETVTKVPLLGDIPLLGWLFRNKSVERKKTNLLIFITPTVLTDRTKLEEFSTQKLEEQKKINAKDK